MKKIIAILATTAATVAFAPTFGVTESAQAACSIPRTPFSPHVPSGTAWRFGGGAGFPDMVPTTGGCTTVVSDAAGLRAALSVATAGTAVYVANSAVIELAGSPIQVPDGVTLASGRGLNGEPGGMISTTVATPGGMIIAGANARITGLRLRGHDITNCASCANSRGIYSNSSGLEVDNNEIYGWTYAGIAFSSGAVGEKVHHNYFRLNRKQEAGYGVVHDGPNTQSLIEWNRFNNNRHAVAGSGTTPQSYEARYNLVLAQSFGHIFDMHGPSVAGTDIRIHHNYIFHIDFASVIVRGVPQFGAWTYANCIARPKKVSAAPAHKVEAIAQQIGSSFSPSGTNFSTGQTPDGLPAGNSFNKTPADCGVALDM